METDEQALVIPDGRAILIWNYKGEYSHMINERNYFHSLGDLHIVGQHTHAIEIQGKEPVNSVGITFKPYGLYMLAELPVTSLTNSILSLHAGITLDFNNIEKSIHVLCNYIEGQIKNYPDANIIHAIQKIDQSQGLIKVHEIISELPVSQRHFNLLFKKQTGLTPKEYISIVRFRSLYNRFLRYKDLENKNELYEYYYDEAQFIHEFKKILHRKPKDFLNKINNFGNFFIKK